MTKRLLQLGGLILIGDGLLGLFTRRRSLFWHLGPELAKAVSEEFTAHRKTSRAIQAAKVAAGVALISARNCEAE
ncbi:MAG TPA: hypothetical protein VM940_07945 [Chthoniobacterales bacterium]|jgi:hypothetical protein|nr:hypothetical protein [Chthoniobacterales bacterium]